MEAIVAFTYDLRIYRKLFPYLCFAESAFRLAILIYSSGVETIDAILLKYWFNFFEIQPTDVSKNN